MSVRHRVTATATHAMRQHRRVVSAPRPLVSARSYVGARKLKVQTSMGGVFEPFLDANALSQKADKEQSPTVSLVNVTCKDILPDDRQLQLMTQQNKIALSLDQQKALAGTVLEHLQTKTTPVDGAQLLSLAGGKPSELTALANIVLGASPHGAPIALEMYRVASEAGDDRGTFSFASMIYHGYRGTEKNVDLGIKLFSRLAEKGHPYAQMNLAAILMRTQKDQGPAVVKLYTLAGKAGVASAYTELGRMYRFGYGVHQDHDKAKAYFEQGAKMGNPQCNFMLGVYHSAEPDQQEKAFKYFQKAAMKGIPEAQYNVGIRYLHGQGTEVNPYNAAEFLRMAALRGFQLAQFNLGMMYADGHGVKQNLDEAREWLEKAASKGGRIGQDAQKRLQLMGNASQKDNSRCSIM